MCCCWAIDRLSPGLTSGLVSLALTNQAGYLFISFPCVDCPRVMTNKPHRCRRIQSSQPYLVMHESLQEQMGGEEIQLFKDVHVLIQDLDQTD